MDMRRTLPLLLRYDENHNLEPHFYCNLTAYWRCLPYLP